MSALLWLLLPVAAMSGWYAAFKHYRKNPHTLQQNRQLNAKYYRGLNYLLTDQQDKAVDIFIEMLEVNSETVELHLALGHLFRKQGEVDRAIRLHQNLIARPTLEQIQRDQIMLELGQDYLKAGLLDRAERIFKELSQSKLVSKKALKLLIDVYQQEKDWKAALASAKYYQKVTGINQSHIMGHFFCELAELSLQSADVEKSKKWAKKALSSDHDLVRASLLQANIAVQERNFKQAVKYLMHVPEQDERYVTEIIEPLLLCIDHVEEKGGLIKAIEQLLPATATSAYAELLQKVYDSESALNYVQQYSGSTVSLSFLKRYVSILLSQADDRVKPAYAKIYDMLVSVSARYGDYLCDQCGFSGNTLYWQCPSCKSWGTVRPS